MVVALLTIKLNAPWVHSLKEKRMELKSLISKIRHTFNVSIIEAQEQDIHQTMVIGIAILAANSRQADSSIDHIINFIEGNTEAVISRIDREFR